MFKTSFSQHSIFILLKVTYIIIHKRQGFSTKTLAVLRDTAIIRYRVRISVSTVSWTGLRYARGLACLSMDYEISQSGIIGIRLKHKPDDIGFKMAI